MKLFAVSKESDGLQLWHEEGLKVPSKRPGKKHCYKEKVMECSLGARRDLYVTKNAAWAWGGVVGTQQVTREETLL